jgi:serine/threonine-protein kinase RsbW
LLLDSTLEGVDEGENLVRAVLQQSRLTEDDRHWVLLAVREVLVNAVAHGNRFDSAKKVSLRMSRGENNVAIEIGDEGDGFEPRSVPDPKLAQNLEKQSGRGLLIARSILDELTISRREPRGTLVYMSKRIPV